jgi:pyruvate dehydrogenase E2 component (dihydrolipoamide acetyltransferase)
MTTEYPMPSLGAGMSEGTVIEWYVKAGDVVRRGDVIGLVDTDKGAIEIEVWEDAEVSEVLVPPGTKVPVGEPLLLLRPPGGPLTAGPEVAPTVPAEVDAGEPAEAPEMDDTSRVEERVRASPVARRRADELDLDLSGIVGSGPGGAVTLGDVEEAVAERTTVARPPGSHLRVTPVARRAAEDLGVDPEGVRGTGPAGAVTRRDVELAAEGAPGRPRRGEEEQEAGKQPEPDRHAAMRRAVAAAMERSKREIPHYYLATTVPLEAALQWLERTNATRPPRERILPIALHLKAVAVALKGYPELNGFWEEDAFRPAERVHAGLAISLRTGGLVAPAIHEVDRRALDDLTGAVRDLVHRARAGSLRASEVTDSTVTVTSLGDRGVETVFGVIYPPQVAIIGVGSVVERPWAHAGMVGVRRTVNLTLSADHRASDGHRGGLFLGEVAALLQTPEDL